MPMGEHLIDREGQATAYMGGTPCRVLEELFLACTRLLVGYLGIQSKGKKGE